MKYSAREAAFMSLMKIEREARYSNIELDAAIKRYGLNNSGQSPEEIRSAHAERALFTILVYGVIERRITLDYIISLFAKQQKIENGVRLILRLGIYQIMYLDRVPDSAACDESVKLCKRRFGKGASGFVNAVLRAICRSKDSLFSRFPEKEKSPLMYLSVKYSVCEELCEMWVKYYGFEKTESILKAFSEVPPMTIRTNTLKTTREVLIENLQSDGIKANQAPSFYGVKLNTGVRIEEMPQFSDGLFFVQDTSSQLCAETIGACPGEFIIDCCAAPGGKSFSIAMEMQNNGRVLSLDLHENKLSLISRSAERLGISIIETAKWDGRATNPLLVEKADRVLCDVPCSGFGVLAKKPELRYKTPADVTRLPETQYDILCTGAAYVKRGGTLVYSTCTLNPAENEHVIERFIAQHPNFTTVNIEFNGIDIKTSDKSFTIFPDDERFNSDGFFITKFIRE